MFTLKDISVIRAGNLILDKINATIQEGDFITVIGANGAGKTTLLETISGKLKPNAGSITFKGKDVTYENEQSRARYISRVFQNPRLNAVDTLTVAQNLALANMKYHRAGLRPAMANLPAKAASEVAQLMEYDEDELLQTRMNRLSGGQRQLIALVMATLSRPKLLLLDEPTAALDPTAATRLMLYAKKLVARHNMTTLLITHDPHLALLLGNKLWVIEDGQLAHEYGPEKVNFEPDRLLGTIDYEALKTL
ncbi:MAG: ATP-binding cassette domain-containing protein [Epsilonproteobacteria bacterium]|nr:ATP-binding cassette domain-containing protein [Campylobacterota bacterium]